LPDLLVTLTAYQLRKGSPVADAGLDLSSLGLTWDPYHYSDDAFIGRFFDATPMDFYGDMLPAPGSNMFSMGADQAS
jgi:hypothetical protein